MSNTVLAGGVSETGIKQLPNNQTMDYSGINWSNIGTTIGNLAGNVFGGGSSQNKKLSKQAKKEQDQNQVNLINSVNLADMTADGLQQLQRDLANTYTDNTTSAYYAAERVAAGAQYRLQQLQQTQRELSNAEQSIVNSDYTKYSYGDLNSVKHSIEQNYLNEGSQAIRNKYEQVKKLIADKEHEAKTGNLPADSVLKPTTSTVTGRPTLTGGAWTAGGGYPNSNAPSVNVYNNPSANSNAYPPSGRDADDIYRGVMDPNDPTFVAIPDDQDVDNPDAIQKPPFDWWLIILLLLALIIFKKTADKKPKKAASTGNTKTKTKTSKKTRSNKKSSTGAKNSTPGKQNTKSTNQPKTQTTTNKTTKSSPGTKKTAKTETTLNDLKQQVNP